MISKEDQRRFEEITQQLRASDPEFVARLGTQAQLRRGRTLIVLTFVLWAAVPAVVVLGGWVAAALAPVVLVMASGLMWFTRRYRWRGF
jgi:fatty acid desaturase